MLSVWLVDALSRFNTTLAVDSIELVPAPEFPNGKNRAGGLEAALLIEAGTLNFSELSVCTGPERASTLHIKNHFLTQRVILISK